MDKKKIAQLDSEQYCHGLTQQRFTNKMLFNDNSLQDWGKRIQPAVLHQHLKIAQHLLCSCFERHGIHHQ